ncbi:microtubule-associated protein futsch isoform X1 [Labrus bergylta]|uniref:microtubule-associated protein futsch isoform X1 n=1 Tax=Labrus bergylta TaxID=56723 RepID=UPI003313B1DB
MDGKKNVSAEVVRTVNRARVLVSKAKIMLIKRISGAKKERKQAKQGTSLESKTTSPETQSVTGDSKHKPVPERSTISIGGSGVGLKGTDANGRVREAAKGPSLDEKVQTSQAQKPKTQEDELAESAAETAGKDESAPSRCVHSESQPHGESLKQSDTECQESPEVRKNTAKSVKVSPPTVVKLQGVDKSLSHCEVLSAAENFGKTKSVVLFRARSEAIVIFEKEEGAQKLKMAESLDVNGRTIPVVVEKETVSKEKTVRQLPKGATTVTEGKVFVSDATHVSAQQRVKTGALSAEGEVKTEAGKQKTPLRSKSGSTENHPDAGDSSQKPVPKKTKTTVREPVVGLRDEPKAPEPATCSVIKTKIKAGSVSTTQKPKSPVDEPSAQEAENIRATDAKDGSKPTKSTDDQSDVENWKPKESEAKVQERLEDPKDTAEVVGKENVAVSTTQKPKTPSEAVTNERMAAPEKSADNPRESQPPTGSVQNQPTETSDKASSQVQERPPSEPAFTARGPETRTEASQEEQPTGGRKNNAGVEEAAGKDGSVPSRSANPQSQPHGVKLEQNEIKIQEFLEVPKDTGTKVEKTVKAHDAEEPVELGVSGAKVVDGKGGETSPEAVPVNSRPQPVETQRTEPSVKASTQVQQSPLSVPETGIEASLKHQQAAGSTKETAVVAAMRGGGAAVKKKRHEDDDASKVVVKVASPVKTEPTAAAEPSRAPRVTVGEMLHEQLYPELIRSVRPYFLTHSRLLPHSHKNVLIFGLPHYYEGFYTEKNVANLLFPFGLRSVDSLYVIPQSGMAFVVMPKMVNVLHFMRECALNGIYLRGTRLHAAVIDFRGNFKILQFYTFLKRLLRCCLFNEKNRTVFISNISPSATRELREALREFGPVTNFMPLLNKVFVEFEFVKDAERFGLWHSQLKRPLGYTWLVIRLNGQIISSPSLGPVPAVATQSGAASAKDASKTAAAGEVSAVMKDKVPTVQKPGISEGTRPAAASVTKGRVAGDATAVPSKSEAPEKQPGAGVPKAKAIPDISATGVKGPGLVGRIEKSKISTKTELGKGPLLEAKVLASKEGMVTTIQKENQAEAGAALHERIAKDGTVPSKDKPSINQTDAGDSKSKPVTDKSDTRVKESGLVETSVVDKLENRTITELGKGPLVGEGVLAFKKEIVSSKQKPETLSGNLAVTEAVSNERIAQDVTEALENQTDAGVPKLNPEPGKSVTNDKEPKVGLKETAKVGQVFAPKKEPLSTKQESKTQVDKLAESRVETNRNIKEAALSVPSRSAETQNPRESFKVKLNELKIHKSLEVSKDTAKVIEKEKVTIFEHEGQGKIDKAHNAEQPMELGVSGAKAGEGRGGETSPEAVPVKSTDKPKDIQPQAVETQPTETSVKASTQVRESTLSEPESTARGPQTRTKASQMKRQAAGSTKEAAVEAVIPGGGAETKTTQHGPATMLTTQTDAAAATSHGDSGLVQRDASTLKQMPEEGSGPIAGKSDDKPAVPDGAGKKRETNNEAHSKELNTRSKDTYQVNDSVEDQPKTTESETENKQEKNGEAMARRDSRPSGRSNPTSKAPIHEEERSPRKQDRTNERHETRQKMDTTADKKLLQSSRESSCRKISTMGNKEEIPTRSTRGKTARKTEDASTEKTKGKDAPTRRSLNKHTVSQEGQSEDGRRRHRKQIQTVDNAGCDKEEKSNEEPTGTTLRSEKRKLDNDTNEVKDETSTPRTRGQPKKITRLTPVSKSTRRKDATSGKEKEEKKASSSSSMDKDSSKLSTDGTLNVQRTAGMKTASKAESGSASVGLENKKLEGCLKEGEKEERSCADLKVVSKKRRDAVGPEAKRSRSQSPSVPADFKLPEFKTNNPLGNEFVVPAYFCNLCSVFYQHESTAEGPHCSSQTHLNNLQKHYEEVQQKSAGSSTKS